MNTHDVAWPARRLRTAGGCLLLALLLLPARVQGQSADSAALRFNARPLLDSLLTHRLPQWRGVLRAAKAHRLQILLTRITRDATGRPIAETFSYRNDPGEYFYPASMVKLPTAIVALEALRAWRGGGIGLDTPFFVESEVACIPALPPGVAGSTLRRLLTAALVVSDNEAYNRLFEFAGRRRIMDRLMETGYPGARIIHSFRGCSLADCGRPPLFRFGVPGGVLTGWRAPDDVREYPARAAGVVLRAVPGRPPRKPATQDFSTRNALPLALVHGMIGRVAVPELWPPSEGFRITDEDRALLQRLLESTPAEAGLVRRDSAWHPTLTNYLYYGAERRAVLNPDLRITNIVGSASGFLSDCAYFHDERSGVEFILSAAVYVGYDGVAAEGEKFYRRSGLPFLRDLGRVVYAWECEQRSTKR